LSLIWARYTFLIRILKKQLYKKIYVFSFLVIVYLSSLFFFLFPSNISIPVKLSVIFLPNILIIFYLIRSYYKKKLSLIIQTQKLQENINLNRLKLDKCTSLVLSLKQRVETYKSLKSIIEKLNQQSDLSTLAEILLDNLFNLIGKGKGNCILYLVDNSTQKLYIFATRKQDKMEVIKAKEGDIFDFWVIKHSTSLLVENTKNDFRFDFEIIQKQSQRTIGSLISSPLISQERLLGIIRLDNPLSYVYNQEDLRLLDTIADFSAVAIENTKLVEQTKELAIKDSLTGCFTKSYLMERIRDEFLKNIKQTKGLSLLILDIDHFKKYNDKFGHIAGDIVLRELGELLNKNIKDKGMVFRFGGEEFCIILPDTTKQEAFEIGQKIINAVRKKTFLLRRHKTSITVSVGLASSPEDANSEDELIFKADYCLYQAKQKGRDQICCI